MKGKKVMHITTRLAVVIASELGGSQPLEKSTKDSKQFIQDVKRAKNSMVL
jgi:hypothetical protein